MNNTNIEKRRQVVTVADIIAERLQPEIGLHYEPLSKQVDALIQPFHKAATEFEQSYQEIGKTCNSVVRGLQQAGLAIEPIIKKMNQMGSIFIQFDQAVKTAIELQLSSPTTGVQPAKRDAASVNSYVYRPFINTSKGRPLLKIADSSCDSALKPSNPSCGCIDKVPEMLANFGFPRAANEMQEAIYDLRRVPPDCTGAMQHAGAALEAIARSISGKQNCTFGKIVKSLDLPPPMDQFASKLWGFASEHGRHIREDRSVDFAMTKSSVICICAICEFLVESMQTK